MGNQKNKETKTKFCTIGDILKLLFFVCFISLIIISVNYFEGLKVVEGKIVEKGYYLDSNIIYYVIVDGKNNKNEQLYSKIKVSKDIYDNTNIGDRYPINKSFNK